MLSDFLVCLFRPLYNNSNENIEYTNKNLLDIFSNIEEYDHEENN